MSEIVRINADYDGMCPINGPDRGRENERTRLGAANGFVPACTELAISLS